MRKVITVNLNGNAYQVDETGFQALSAYLQRAEAQLADYPDRGEIIADLEQAIGDKCDTFLGAHKTVVSVAEVEQILREMGPVERPAGSNDDVLGSSRDGQTGTTHAAGDAQEAAGAARRGFSSRRLYRLPDEGMLGGVCAGFAAYFSVDVVWMRLLFVLLAFTTGVWFFVWLVLWFVMPRAISPEDVAAAHGEPFNAREVLERAKKKSREYASAAARAGRRHWQRSEPHVRQFGASFSEGVDGVKSGAEAMSSRLRDQARRHRRARYRRAHGDARMARVSYPAQVAAGITLPFLSLVSAALFATFLVSLLSLLSAGTILGWTALPRAPQWVTIVLLVVAYFLVASPISALRRASHRYANGGRDFGWASTWDSLLWVGLVTLFLWLAYDYAPGLRELLQTMPAIFESSRGVSV